MPNNTPVELNKSWICGHLHDVTDTETKKAAWVLVQEPGFVGFGAVYRDKIYWPPHESSDKPSEWEPDWERVSDLRLFGENGEWHVWLDWQRKHQCRLLEFDPEDEWCIWLGPEGKNQCEANQSGQKDDILAEYHFLWGTKKGKSRYLVEDRGAEIWLPLAEFDDLEEEFDLPLRLKLKQVIAYDPKYHLAGIIDAALVALLRKSGEVPLMPSSSLLCPESRTVEATKHCSEDESSKASPDS